MILSQNKTIASCPEKSGVVRVNEYQQNLVIQHVDDENLKSKIFFFSFLNSFYDKILVRDVKPT